MLDSISPYALLQASRPKPTPTLVTAYDLYSAAHAAAQSDPAPDPQPPQRTDTPSPIPAAQKPATRRTHYIADIKSRHNAAVRRAPLHNQPLS